MGGTSVEESKSQSSKQLDSEDGLAPITDLKQAWLSVASFFFALGPVIGLGYVCFAPIAANITQELGDPALTAWTLNAWTLASTISFLACGYVSDICGRRYLLLLGSFLAIIGFVVCAVAQDVATLIAGQALLGLSTGLLFTVYSAAAEMLPKRWCSVAVGIIDCGFALPWVSFAVLIANSLLQQSTWRWIFYMGIILETIGLIGMFFFYRPRHASTKKSAIYRKLRSFDVIGLILFTIGLTGILIGLLWAGTPTHSWSNASTLCPIIIGISAVVSSVAWDATIASLPILPWSLFRHFKKYGSLNSIIFLTGMTFFPMLSYLPQGLYVMFTQDPVNVGVLSLPQTLGQGIVVLLGTVLARKFGRPKYQLMCLIALQIVFYAATVSAFNPNRKFAFVFLPAVSVSTYGWIGILNITIISANVPRSVLATAIALNSSLRTAGGALGGAIYKVIFEDAYSGRLVVTAESVLQRAQVSGPDAGNILAACLRVDFVSIIRLTSGRPEMTDELLQAVRNAYGHGLQMLFCTAVALSMSALVAAAFLDDSSLATDRQVDGEIDIRSDQRCR